MRPVNLLPEGVGSGTRRGISVPGGDNALGYVIAGCLLAVLIAVFAMTHYGNQVGEKEDQLAQLQAQEAETQARAESLASFASFQAIKESRQLTITALAESRFDWERVMRELALVIPERVWLTNLTGTVSPSVAVEKAASVTLRSAVPGPALQLVGCARSQRDVARLISALEDIDGVTRVAAENSLKPSAEITATADSGEVDTASDCRTRDFITQFGVVAAFDAVSVPAGAEPGVPVAPAAPATTETTATTTETTASTETTDAPANSPEEQAALQGGVDAAGGEQASTLSGGGKQR